MREREREWQTIPVGKEFGDIDLCIISSNWNVLEPGAAHTASKTSVSENSEKLVFLTPTGQYPCIQSHELKSITNKIKRNNM